MTISGLDRVALRRAFDILSTYSSDQSALARGAKVCELLRNYLNNAELEGDLRQRLDVALSPIHGKQKVIKDYVNELSGIMTGQPR